MRLAAGTVVAEVECASCGNEVLVKVNKNGSLYTVCTSIINPATREKCFHRECWGREASKKMITELTASIPTTPTATKEETHGQNETIIAASSPDHTNAADNAGATSTPATTAGNNPAAGSRGGLFGAWG